MKTLQIKSMPGDTMGISNNNGLLRMGGVKRIHPGWYTCRYNGVVLDRSTITRATRNKHGEIKG